jgi:uncharacterized glyoxalase superfamily protein PhnB
MKLQTIYLTVNDFDRSLDFYRKIFNRHESLIMPWGQGSDRVAFFELDDFRFMMSFEEQLVTSTHRQRVWLEFEDSDPSATLERLEVEAIQISERLHHTPAGSTAFNVVDPDGNSIRFGTRWDLPKL